MKVVQAPGTEATSSRRSQKTSEGCGLSGETRTERYLASVPWHSGARSQLSIVWTLHFAPVAGQDAGKEGSFPSGQLCPGTEALGADANNAHAKPCASIPWGKLQGGSAAPSTRRTPSLAATTRSSNQTTISSQQLRVQDVCHTRLLLEAEVPFVEKASLCL